MFKVPQLVKGRLGYRMRTKDKCWESILKREKVFSSAQLYHQLAVCFLSLRLQMQRLNSVSSSQLQEDF